MYGYILFDTDYQLLSSTDFDTDEDANDGDEIEHRVFAFYRIN